MIAMSIEQITEEFRKASVGVSLLLGLAVGGSAVISSYAQNYAKIARYKATAERVMAKAQGNDGVLDGHEAQELADRLEYKGSLEMCGENNCRRISVYPKADSGIRFYAGFPEQGIEERISPEKIKDYLESD